MRFSMTHPHRLIPLGDSMPNDWNPVWTGVYSTTGLLVDRDDENDCFTDKEEGESDADALDAGDHPVSGISLLLMNQAIDAAAARSH